VDRLSGTALGVERLLDSSGMDMDMDMDMALLEKRVHKMNCPSQILKTKSTTRTVVETNDEKTDHRCCQLITALSW
jgi:hypothetical protein